MKIAKKKFLITNALIYANAPAHLGHFLGCIQADIWVRFLKAQGHHCIFLCGDDAHGTPIMLRAEQAGLTPTALINQIYASHRQDMQDFSIDYDEYHTTHSEENRRLTEEIYYTLKKNGYITHKTIEQAFDPVKQLFLPDRFIKGTCPRCKAIDQYGDSCESCGATYTPAELIDPISILSNSTPISKTTQHFFFDLPQFEDFLKNWMQTRDLQPEVVNKLQEWFKTGLQCWDITRDQPYFGFEIPDSPGQYFYVWMDAPIGYISTFQKYAEKHPDALLSQYWKPTHPPDDPPDYLSNNATQLIHFIGKDITYFHALFWPAVLHGAGYKTPDALYVNGFLTVNGKKMSKSRGTFILARTFLDHIGSDNLRYYFACKSSTQIVDLDLNLEDFMQRVNSDLVGKCVNIASRCSVFLEKHFNHTFCATLTTEQTDLYERCVSAREAIAEDYHARELGAGLKRIMQLADEINQYIDAQKPWLAIKNTQNPMAVQNVHQTCSLGIMLFRILMTYLSPVVPILAQKSADYLRLSTTDWDNINHPPLQHRLGIFKPLLSRIEKSQIEQILTLSKAHTMELTHNTTADLSNTIETIDFEYFQKIDLRIGRILEVHDVPEASKLLKLLVDIGSKKITLFAGIKEKYKITDLENKLTLVVTNLKPRKMRFGVSEGMLLVAGDSKRIFLMQPEQGAEPGMAVK
jgi:methionyl-tRNA synthetase